MNTWSTRKKIAIITAGFIVVTVVILLIINTATPKNNNPYGDQVTIKNYDVKNLPADRRDSIFASLYKIIALNQAEGSKKPDINDAILRKDSEQQDYSSQKDIYVGHFIVDIKSIGQSYYVQYTYSDNATNPEVGGYPVTATCLAVNQLIYGDFSCKDALQLESAGVDPIIKYLPQSTLSYQITANVGSDQKTALTIQLLLTEADYRIGEQAAVDAYKKEAIDWMISKGLTPENYTINYTH